MTVFVWKFIDTKEEPLLQEINLENQEKLSMNDISRQLPTGGYTTFRTYQRDYVINLDNHFSRLEETARLTGCSIDIPRENLRKGLRKVIEKSAYSESRIRISIDFNHELKSIFLMIEPLKTPPIERYINGVSIITKEGGRRNAKAKLSGFIATAQKIRQGLGSDYEEILLVNNSGEILEGLTSNFFAIQNCVLRTADRDVLSGITRGIVLDLAREMAIQVKYDPINLSEIENISEAFITSASRGILPVCKINGINIGSGNPGEISRKLMEKFEKKTLSIIEKI